jgi:hypothetical protein
MVQENFNRLLLANFSSSTPLDHDFLWKQSQGRKDTYEGMASLLAKVVMP